jgi:hypothetical protein
MLSEYGRSLLSRSLGILYAVKDDATLPDLASWEEGNETLLIYFFFLKIPWRENKTPNHGR